MEAACNIFHSIYGHGTRSSIVNNLLKRLDFHALSITLLATTASHNAWDYDRLAQEWDTQRAQVLRTDYNKSLAATIELSLASPTFRSLGSNARDLLGVVAFFPQGINEKNFDWLCPTISNAKHIFDKFCLLTLTYRSNGFLAMLAPLRDYLGPQDPQSSPLLCATMDHYFSRLSAGPGPGMPDFEEGRWIVSEDVNVEHLLEVFLSIDPHRGNIWDACYRFMEHLYWHKPRQTMLRSKIEALPEDHPTKPTCLRQLSLLLGQIGNYAEQKPLLIRALELERRRGDVNQVAYTLRQLSDANRNLDLFEEGIQQAKEALEIFKRIGNTTWEMQCSNDLALLLFDDKQLDAAEGVASHAIGLVAEKGQEILVCRLHRVLGKVFQSKGEKQKSIHHYEAAIGIASPFNWCDELFWNHHDLARSFAEGGQYDDATAHATQAKSYAVNQAYKLGRATEMQAIIWYWQSKLEVAKSEASHAIEILEKLGATKDAGVCKHLLQEIEQAMKNRPDSSLGGFL